MILNLNPESVMQSFKQREYETAHLPYETLLKNYNLVKLGDSAAVGRLCDTFFNNTTSHLSADPLQNKQFLFVVSITMVTQHSIEGGVLMEDAFNLSDLYIQKVSHCKNIAEIDALYEQAVTHFIQCVKDSSSKSQYPPAVQICIDYIHLHLHMPISMKDLCDAMNLSPTYLTSIFKKATGITPTGYIRRERIAAASNLLRYSDFPYADISNYLCFSSQSHFTQVFHQETGLTPKQYRDKYFRRNYTASINPEPQFPS